MRAAEERAERYEERLQEAWRERDAARTEVERDAADAIRALAACYDEQLLRSDHVVDDLLEDGRGWLKVSRAHPGRPGLALTMEGRQRIVAMLIEAQGDV
jgi:hypothetical protein